LTVKYTKISLGSSKKVKFGSKQLLDIRREGTSQFFENRDCRILQSTFETADIGPVDPGIDGKFFLRQAALQPKMPDISRNDPAQ
jgi:hypothetical protein